MELACIRYQGIKFDGLHSKDGSSPPLALAVYKTIIRNHFIKNGMWNVFQYKHPKSKGMICLINTMGQVKLPDIKKYMIKVKSTADKYAMQNLDWSGSYLLNSISNNLTKKVLQKVSVDDTGPEILVAIVSSFGTFTFDSMEKLKENLKKVSLLSYPGENVVNMNQDLLTICERLSAAGYWDKNLLHYLATKYLSSTCELFRIWVITNITEKTTSYLNDTSLYSDQEISPSSVMTYHDIIEKTSHKYEDMLGSQLWTPHVPSKKQKDEPDLSAAGLQAAVDKAVKSSLAQIGAKHHKKNQGKGNGGHKQKGSGKKDIIRCNICDVKGHKASECPHKGIRWYKVPPVNNQFKRHHAPFGQGPKPITWCTICNSWRYDEDGGHFAKDHETWKATQGKNKGKKKQPSVNPNAAVAEVSEGADSSDDEGVIGAGFAALFDGNWI